MLRAILVATFAFAGPLLAQDQNLSQFRNLSSLAEEGFETIPVQGGGAVFGMRKAAEIYLCYLEDKPALRADRQRVISEYSSGQSENRTLPNVPVVCVKAE
ncbi:hypothetical protein OCH239_02875 [Roseivivax halodurans JCM 10272]|uniref:Uncharacterized protein n=1 Tax=Roseivivax halodurans JCM 10272 TaxID=1449350 RepID=X7EHH3_9RHOB|nr:hypothetical protein [Roseivivax halodurans]ETX14578.1 hypothetical protein OCH239_02875 [Roseivivax halodurans JCM 10272]